MMLSVQQHPTMTSPIPHPQSGSLQVIFGPMFSGKTTELIRRCKRYQLAKYKCAVVKYAKDDRYSADSVSTHDRQMLSAISTVSLSSILNQLISFEVIGIDEGQFFSDVVDVTEQLANIGKTVIVAALDGDYRREGFGDILSLVPKAESVVKLRAVCMSCYRDAAFTKRLTDDTALELIGGTDTYTAACRACHRELSPLKANRKNQATTPELVENSSGPNNIDIPPEHGWFAAADKENRSPLKQIHL